MTNSTQTYYDTHAEEYFQATAGAILQTQWDALAHRLKPGSTILDLGSGSGRDLRHFSERGFQPVGIDYSPSLAKLSQGYARRPIVLGDMTSLPFQDQSFDAAWAVGSFLHLPPRALLLALMETHRVLKPGGYLFASIKRGKGHCEDSHGRMTYFHEVDSWAKLLRRLDFNVLDIQLNTERRTLLSGEIQCIEWIETLAHTSSK